VCSGKQRGTQKNDGRALLFNAARTNSMWEMVLCVFWDAPAAQPYIHCNNNSSRAFLFWKEEKNSVTPSRINFWKKNKKRARAQSRGSAHILRVHAYRTLKRSFINASALMIITRVTRTKRAAENSKEKCASLVEKHNAFWKSTPVCVCVGEQKNKNARIIYFQYIDEGGIFSTHFFCCWYFFLDNGINVSYVRITMNDSHCGRREIWISCFSLTLDLETSMSGFPTWILDHTAQKNQISIIHKICQKKLDV